MDFYNFSAALKPREKQIFPATSKIEGVELKLRDTYDSHGLGVLQQY